MNSVAVLSLFQIFSKTYQGLQEDPPFEDDDVFVIDSTVGRNVTFQLDYDNSECDFTDDNGGNVGDFHVDIYKSSVRIRRYFFNTDNENDNYRVDVFQFTITESVATQFQPGTYWVKVEGIEDKPECTMTLLITSLAADDEIIPIRYII